MKYLKELMLCSLLAGVTLVCGDSGNYPYPDEWRCDNYVQTTDGADEHDCRCIERLEKTQLCDNVKDCPNGEDEDHCHGYGEEYFSCMNDESYALLPNATNYVKKSSVCDGTVDCPYTGHDEKECLRLNTFVSDMDGVRAEGYLQRMINGHWHTVCHANHHSSDYYLERYAAKACEQLVGFVDEAPIVARRRMGYHKHEMAPFAHMSQIESSFSPDHTCSSNTAYYVTCPDPECGWPVSTFDKDRSHRYKRSFAKEAEGLQGKIVGGRDTYHGDYPFIAAIYRNGSFHCGGSIIDKSHILSAAHCFHKHEKYIYEIQVGQTRRYSWSPYEQSRRVTKIISHQRYDSKIFLNDIAIVKLDSPIHLSKWVTTACLPPADLSMEPHSDQYCTVVGWGDLSEGGGYGPNHMQEVELPVLARCQEIFTKDTHQICAGYKEGQKDACQGDSGGPFICWYDSKRSILNGLVSFGRGCARKNQAGVYTRVSAYLNWIETTLTVENADTYHYPEQPYQSCPGQSCHLQGGQCIFPSMRCNREVECLGMEDEKDCDYDSKYKKDMEPDLHAYTLVHEAVHETHEHTHDYGESKLCGPNEFQCQISKTCVYGNLRCNGKFDCQDETDEKGCDCGDIIKNVYPSLHCDFIEQCHDGSDERDCATCEGVPGMVKCPFSHHCIRSYQFCDGIPHCEHGLDEANCISFTRSKKKMPSEKFFSDQLSRGLPYGYVAARIGSTEWSPLCKQDGEDRIEEAICAYLGYEGSSTHYGRSFKRNQRSTVEEKLNIVKTIAEVRQNSVTAREKCTPIKTRCGEPLCGQRLLYSFSNYHPGPEDPSPFPWLLSVHINGKPSCFATMLNRDWGVTSTECLESHSTSLKKDYLSVVSGFSNITYIVGGPTEQAKRVNSYLDNGEVTFLHFESQFKVDPFTTPICIVDKEFINPSHWASAKCSRVAVDFQSSYLKFRETSVQIDVACSMKNHRYCIYGDVIQCEDNSPSFVYCSHDNVKWHFLGFIGNVDASKCLSQGIQMINPFYGVQRDDNIKVLTNPPVSTIPHPKCEGKQSMYGNCVPKNKVCDGISHSVDYVDERRCDRLGLRAMDEAEDDDEAMTALGRAKIGNYHKCPMGHFACRTSGQCIPISGFCDGQYFDCEDYSDEPMNEEDCSCKHYLEMASPQSICDGHVNCPVSDEGHDEYPCPCYPGYFKCGSYSNSSCIRKNLVCDGRKDCPNGDDEKRCVEASTSLITLEIDKAENQKEGYVMRNVRGVWHPYCSLSWSYNLGSELCKYFGFKKLARLETQDLHEFRFMRESEMLDEGLEPEDELAYSHSPVQLYTIQYGELTPNSFDQRFESCTTASIECRNS